MKLLIDVIKCILFFGFLLLSASTFTGCKVAKKPDYETQIDNKGIQECMRKPKKL